MHIRSLVCGLLTLALPVRASLAAQRADATAATRAARAVSADVMRAHLEFLADDALEGRAPGTRGGLIAAKYIRAQFQRLGLEPAGDTGSYYHRVPIISLTPTPTLTVRPRSSRTRRRISLATAVALPASPRESVTSR